MRPRSIRVPDHIDEGIVQLALERQTSYTEVVIWAAERYLGIEGEMVARQDRRTISAKVPVAGASQLPPKSKNANDSEERIAELEREVQALQRQVGSPS